MMPSMQQLPPIRDALGRPRGSQGSRFNVATAAGPRTVKLPGPQLAVGGHVARDPDTSTESGPDLTKSIVPQPPRRPCGAPSGPSWTRERLHGGCANGISVRAALQDAGGVHASGERRTARWGTMKVTYTELLDAVDGMSLPKLLTAVAHAQALGVTYWQEYGVAERRLKQLQQLEDELEEGLTSIDTEQIDQILCESQSLPDTATVAHRPLVKALQQRSQLLSSLRARLSLAAQEVEPQRITDTLRSAQCFGVVGWPEMEAAEARLLSLETALQGLREATSSGDRTRLEAAIVSAHALGVNSSIEAPLGPAFKAAQRVLEHLRRRGDTHGRGSELRCQPKDIDPAACPFRVSPSDPTAARSCAAAPPGGLVQRDTHQAAAPGRSARASHIDAHASDHADHAAVPGVTPPGAAPRVGACHQRQALLQNLLAPDPSGKHNIAWLRRLVVEADSHICLPHRSSDACGALPALTRTRECLALLASLELELANVATSNACTDRLLTTIADAEALRCSTTPPLAQVLLESPSSSGLAAPACPALDGNCSGDSAARPDGAGCGLRPASDHVLTAHIAACGLIATALRALAVTPGGRTLADGDRVGSPATLSSCEGVEDVVAAMLEGVVDDAISSAELAGTHMGAAGVPPHTAPCIIKCTPRGMPDISFAGTTLPVSAPQADASVPLAAGGAFLPPGCSGLAMATCSSDKLPPCHGMAPGPSDQAVAPALPRPPATGSPEPPLPDVVAPGKEPGKDTASALARTMAGSALRAAMRSALDEPEDTRVGLDLALARHNHVEQMVDTTVCTAKSAATAALQVVTDIVAVARRLLQTEVFGLGDASLLAHARAEAPRSCSGSPLPPQPARECAQRNEAALCSEAADWATSVSCQACRSLAGSGTTAVEVLMTGLLHTAFAEFVAVPHPPDLPRDLGVRGAGAGGLSESRMEDCLPPARPAQVGTAVIPRCSGLVAGGGAVEACSAGSAGSVATRAGGTETARPGPEHAGSQCEVVNDAWALGSPTEPPSVGLGMLDSAAGARMQGAVEVPPTAPPPNPLPTEADSMQVMASGSSSMVALDRCSGASSSCCSCPSSWRVAAEALVDGLLAGAVVDP